MTQQGNRIVTCVVCLLLLGSMPLHAAPIPAPPALPGAMQSSGAPPVSPVLPYEGPQPTRPGPNPDTSLLDEDGEERWSLDSFGNPVLDPGGLRFDNFVDTYEFSPHSGTKNAATPAPSPLVTPLGLSRPRLVAANGPLRAGSALSDSVAIAVAARTVYVYLNRGDGIRAAPTSIYVNVVNDIPTAVAIGDVNGDGKPDLVVADAGNNAVIVLPGKGDGTFGAPVSYSLGATPVSPASIALADLDGDGKLDIVTGNIGSVTVLLNNGSGGFLPPGERRFSIGG